MNKTKTQKHEYERKYPQQAKAYKEIVDSMYKLFLDKGLEYSVNNVKAIGVFGLTLRIVEKVIRLTNIIGWDIFEGVFTKSITNPKFGSVKQELEDIANLAIIAMIVARNKWAK